MKILAWVIMTWFVVSWVIGTFGELARAFKRYGSGGFAAFTWAQALLTAAEVWAFFYLWQLR